MAAPVGVPDWTSRGCRDLWLTVTWVTRRMVMAITGTGLRTAHSRKGAGGRTGKGLLKPCTVRRAGAGLTWGRVRTREIPGGTPLENRDLHRVRGQ